MPITDSNTAALNDYMLEQDRADRDAEFRERLAEQNKEEIDDAVLRLIISKIAVMTPEATEAVGGEEFEHGDYAFIAAHMAALSKAKNHEQKKHFLSGVGDLVVNKFKDYLRTEDVEEQAKREVLG